MKNIDWLQHNPILLPDSNERFAVAFWLSRFSFFSSFVLPLLRISKLVTRRSASVGDFLKKCGDKFGGNVNGLRLAADASHDRPVEWIRSKFSFETGRFCFCFGYHPRPGPPAMRSISLLSRAWLIFRCPGRPFNVLPAGIYPKMLFSKKMITL